MGAPDHRPPHPHHRRVRASLLVATALVAAFSFWRARPAPSHTAAMASVQTNPGRAPHPVAVSITAPVRSPAPSSFAQIDAAEDDPEKREVLIAAWLAQWSPGRERIGLDALPKSGASPAMAELQTRLIRRWAETDPQAAAQWVITLPQGANREKLLGHVGIVWANHDLTAAGTWAQNLPDPAERLAAVDAVAGEAVRTDALVTLDLITPQPDGPARDALLLRAAAQLAVNDAEALAKWAVDAPPGPVRDKLLAGVALAWSEQNPTKAAALVQTNLPKGRLRDDTLVGIAQRWGRQDPSQANQWIQGWPDGQARLAAIENLAPK